MSPDVTFIFRLRPITTLDEETGLYSARLSDFPQLIAYDETKDGAMKRLDNLFEVMLNERQEFVVKTLIEQQIALLIKERQMKVSKLSRTLIDGERENNMELEMVTS